MSIKPELTFKSGIRQNFLTLPPITDNPLVSIVMPSYDQGEFIHETILTIQNQDYQNWELVVVDGASKDNTIEVLAKCGKEDPRIKWVSEPDRGTIHAFNKGIWRAAGEIIGIQQTSDTYQPGVFSQAVAEFTQDLLLAMVGGSTREMDINGKSLDTVPSIAEKSYVTLEDIVAFQGNPPLQATFFRRDLAQFIGGFDEAFYTSHIFFFFHYMLEGIKQGTRFLLIPDHWATFRRHPESNSDRFSADGLKGAMDIREACQKFENEYPDVLSKEQRRSLLQFGYRIELGFRVGVKKQIFPAVPSLLGYLRNGGLTANRKMNIFSHAARLLRPSSSQSSRQQAD